MPPLLETLPLKRSQDASVPRRLVYLDQNVVSNIGKARLGRPMASDLAHATQELYAAIQGSVRDRQDAICIESMFHRTESSGLVVMANEDRKSDAHKLFHEIAQFVTYYSFTLQLSPCGELLEVQSVLAVANKLGLTTAERRRYNWRAALSRDPHSRHDVDGRVVDVGGHKFVLGAEWRPRTVREEPWAAHVTQLRSEGAYKNYEATIARIKQYQRGDAVRANQSFSWAGRWDDSLPRSAVDEFIQSDSLFDVPLYFVSRQLYAHVLSERTRAFKDSDPNDIDILSSAIPYCDLVITDKYMAEAAVQRGFDTAFNATILPATPDGLYRAAEFLNRDVTTPAC